MECSESILIISQIQLDIISKYQEIQLFTDPISASVELTIGQLIIIQLGKTITYQKGPLTVTNFVPTFDFPETLLTNPSYAYYWRVYAVDSAGNIGTNSLTRNFRVSTSPPLLWGDLPAGINSVCENPWPTGCIVTRVTLTEINLALALKITFKWIYYLTQEIHNLNGGILDVTVL